MDFVYAIFILFKVPEIIAREAGLLFILPIAVWDFKYGGFVSGAVPTNSCSVHMRDEILISSVSQ